MIAAGYTSSSTACMVCLTFAVGLGGFAWGGFSVNHLDIAPQVSLLCSIKVPRIGTDRSEQTGQIQISLGLRL